MARRFGMEIDGRWHLFARSKVQIYGPSGLQSVPLRIFVADRSAETPDLKFAVVQSPRKLRSFAEGIRGDRKFIEALRVLLEKEGARNVEALGFSDDSDIGTELSMILEGPLVLPSRWEKKIAPRPKAPPKLLDPGRVKIGQSLRGSQVFRLSQGLGSEQVDRYTKVAQFVLTLKGKRTPMNVFIPRDVLKTDSWATLQLVTRTGEDEAVLQQLHDHDRQVIGAAALAFQSLGIVGTSTLRIHATPGILNAVTLACSGLDFKYSALEAFARSLGVNVPKLRKYREEMDDLLKTAAAVCGSDATSGVRPFLVQGSGDRGQVVARLQELGWVRNSARSGNNPDRGFHYFRKSSRKLTVNLGIGPSPVYFEPGWREPFAAGRTVPYLRS